MPGAIPSVSVPISLTVIFTASNKHEQQSREIAIHAGHAYCAERTVVTKSQPVGGIPVKAKASTGQLALRGTHDPGGETSIVVCRPKAGREPVFKNLKLITNCLGTKAID